MKDSLVIGGREFISVGRASELTKYSKDYIGQLCREGKIAARMIGRTWFVDSGSVVNYKKAVDTQYSNNTQWAQIKTPDHNSYTDTSSTVDTRFSNTSGTLISYSSDQRPALPVLKKSFADGHDVQKVVRKIRDRARRTAWPSVATVRNISLFIACAVILSGALASFVFVTNGVHTQLASRSSDTQIASVSSFFDSASELFMRILGRSTDSISTDIDKPPPDGEGIVVIPLSDPRIADEIVRQRIQQEFSDEVYIEPDVGSTTGVITPVFRGSQGDRFRYVLVPVRENVTR